MRYAVLVGMMVLLSGCGTIVAGTKQTIGIQTLPIGATVKVDGGAEYTAPTSVVLARSKEHMLVVSKDGHQPQTVVIEKSFAPLRTILGNLLWLLPGIVIDAVSGGAYDLEPAQVSVQLQPKPAAGPAPAAGGDLVATKPRDDVPVW